MLVSLYIIYSTTILPVRIQCGFLMGYTCDGLQMYGDTYDDGAVHVTCLHSA